MADQKATSPCTENVRSTEDHDLEVHVEEPDYTPQLTPPPNAPADSHQVRTQINTNSDASNSDHITTYTQPQYATYQIPSAHITIQALQQQLYVSEQNTLHLHHQATQHIRELDALVHTTWQRSAHLEATVAHLASQLERASAYNATLNEHVRTLRFEAEKKEKQRRAAVEKEKRTAAANATVATTPPPPPPPLPMWDENTLLEHNRKTIRVLRGEIRGLKEGKKGLEERLVALGEKSCTDFADSRKFLRWAEMRVPRHVLEELNEVLVGKERKIVGLEVMLEREREARSTLEKQKCTKCEPVVVIDDEGA